MAEGPTVAPSRHPGRWVAGGAVILFGGLLLQSLLRNPNVQWGVVARYFTANVILSGLGLTIELTIIAMCIGIALGLVLAIMRLSGNPVLTTVGWLYIWLFRSTPLLVQIIFWFNLSALYPRLSLGLPWGLTLISVSTNAAITTLTAAILGLGLHEAAYMAEIIRSGISSVSKGQVDAAKALGMTSSRALRRIILPQAVRVILPPTGNEVISTLKATSLVSVISLADVLYSAEIIYSRTFQTIPLLVVASLWYLIVTSILTVGQSYLERHFTKGQRTGDTLSLWRRLGTSLLRFHRNA